MGDALTALVDAMDPITGRPFWSPLIYVQLLTRYLKATFALGSVATEDMIEALERATSFASSAERILANVCFPLHFPHDEGSSQRLLPSHSHRPPFTDPQISRPRQGPMSSYSFTSSRGAICHNVVVGSRSGAGSRMLGFLKTFRPT
jgi:hypothetical protein